MPQRLAAVDLDAWRGKLQKRVEEAECNDPRKLRPRIAELEREIAAGNAWDGKYAEHDPDPTGHSEGRCCEAALKHLVDTVVDLPTGDPTSGPPPGGPAFIVSFSTTTRVLI